MHKLFYVLSFLLRKVWHQIEDGWQEIRSSGEQGIKVQGIGLSGGGRSRGISNPSTHSTKLPPSLFYFAGGYVETSFGGQAGQAPLRTGIE